MRLKKKLVIIPFFSLLILLLSSAVPAAEKSFSLDGFFSSIFGPEQSEEFHKVLPLKSDGTFSLKNVNGSIFITTWKEEKVEIEAIKTTKGDPDRLKLVNIEVESTPGSVSVDTVYLKRKNIRVKVKYDVKVPEGVNLEKIRSVNGNVYISGPLADVKASTTNGKIELEGASGNLSLSTTNGKIQAVNVRGELYADTTNGSIELEMLSFEDAVKARTVNGGITLRIGTSEKINADLTAKTVNGRIHLDFPVTFQSIQKSRRSLEGQIGQGGPQISLRTVNGSIKITK